VPRLIALVADPAEQGECLVGQRRSLVEPVAEDVGHPAEPKCVGEAARVVEPAPLGDRILEHRGRRAA